MGAFHEVGSCKRWGAANLPPIVESGCRVFQRLPPGEPGSALGSRNIQPW